MTEFKTHDIEVLGEKLTLCNGRAVFWERERALIISDLHVGKTAHFRKNGIAVPSDILGKDLQRLEDLVKYFSAKKIIFVGDLLHAGNNSDVDLFCHWRRKFGNVEFHLIEGNHDRLSEKLAEKLCLTSRQESLKIENFCFVHEFSGEIPDFQITGHIHPGIVFKTKIKNMRLPCFALAENQLLLPAFSEFTGLDTKNTPQNAAYFVFTKSEIFRL